MGEMNGNKMVGIGLISFIILLAIWKFPVMGDFEWGFVQKVILSVAGIGAVTLLYWMKE